jgi:hypothetical protein
MIVIKNFFDLNKIEIKNFYLLVSSSNISKYIDNSILWELLNLRRLLSNKGSKKVSSNDISNPEENNIRLDYVILDDNYPIGYFCIRNLKGLINKTKNKYENNIFLYIIESKLTLEIVNILLENIINIKKKYYSKNVVFLLNVMNNDKLVSLLDGNSSCKFVKIDNKIYDIPLYIYQLITDN